jgi:hypothetical protein
MRIVTMSLGAGAAALSLIAAQPAWAVHTQVEITGTAHVVDTTGLSGPPNTTYDTAFDLTFFTDDHTPGASFFSGAQFPFTHLQALSGDNDANPVRSDIELGSGFGFSSGHNYGPPDGTANGTAAHGLLDPTSGFGSGGAMVYVATTIVSDPDFYLLFFNELAIISPSNFGQAGDSLSHPFTYDFQPEDTVLYADGEYLIQAGDARSISQQLEVTLTPKTLTVTSDAPSGVPEPATWALMIAGFGGAGAALRRRARPAVVG